MLAGRRILYGYSAEFYDPLRVGPSQFACSVSSVSSVRASTLNIAVFLLLTFVFVLSQNQHMGEYPPPPRILFLSVP
jgi:hypothetical protein